MGRSGGIEGVADTASAWNAAWGLAVKGWKRRIGIAATVLMAAATFARAETRALIVGASGYPNLPENIRLTGPKNDVRAVASTLHRLGVPARNISVLADGVSNLPDGIPAGEPGTHEAILAGLDRLAAESRPGDLVVFFFSGHGSQAPDLNGDEEGGMDEILLPYDVGSWNAQGVKGALVDDELDARITRILDKGVDFFGIVDACHSATGFRDLPGAAAKARRVLPAELGVPDDQVSSRSLPAPSVARFTSGKSGQAKGRSAFFYAAQEVEEALETSRKEADGTEANYGVFTYNLLRRLNETPGLSYRRLHQAVVSDIKRGTMMATQTPEVEGTMLDEPALRLGSAGMAARQWPIYAGKLNAGALDGLSNGAVLALYDDPGAADDKLVARGVVENAGTTRSVVAPLRSGCTADAAASCAEQADPAAFKKARWARLVEPGVDFSLTVSEPFRVDPNDGKDYGPALAAFRAALAGADMTNRVTVSASAYDMAVGLVDGTLAFAAEPGMIDADGPNSSPRLSLPDAPEAAQAVVASALNRIARAVALQRLGADTAGGGLGLQTKVTVRRAGAGRKGEACAADDAAYAVPVEAGRNDRFRDCDILGLSVSNDGRKPLDVTVLLVGRDFSITPVWPEAGEANRIQPGEEKKADLLQMEPDPSGGALERLVLIAVPGVGRSHTVFDTLTQEGLRAAPGMDDDAPSARRMLLAASGDGEARAVSTPAGLDEEMAVNVLPFRVEPGRAEAGGN